MDHARRRFDHIVFDLDGTLVDSLADLAAAVNHMRRTLSLAALPLQTVAGAVGEGARLLVQRALGPDHADTLDEALKIFLAYYGDHLLDQTRPYPGIVDTLVALHAGGAVLSVLTNKPAAPSRAIVEGVGLAPYFVAVVGGDALPTRKPDPAGLQHLARLTATPPDRMLLVGDSVVDARTARAAGVPFCGVAWGFNTTGLRAAAPERLIDRPAELLAIVGG